MQRRLGVGELSRLGFGATLPPAAQRVGMEGDWLDRFARLLGPQGRWTRRVLSPTARTPGDPERVLGHELVLDNATFRLLGVLRPGRAIWCWISAPRRCRTTSATSSLRLGVNLATGALPDAMLAALGPAVRSPFSFDSDRADPDAPGGRRSAGALGPRPRAGTLVARALPPRLEAALDPFVKGMRRRLAATKTGCIATTTICTMRRCAARRRCRRVIRNAAREEQRAEAIGREYRAKLDDLARQYATRVTVEWVQTLELVMPVHRFVGADPAAQGGPDDLAGLEPAGAAAGAAGLRGHVGIERPRLVCDDALHLVVPAALGPAAAGGRSAAHATAACPKCGTDGQMP